MRLYNEYDGTDKHYCENAALTRQSWHNCYEAGEPTATGRQAAGGRRVDGKQNVKRFNLNCHRRSQLP